MKADEASATAYLIATSTLFVAADPRAGQLIPVRAAELSACFVQTGSRLVRWLHEALPRQPARLFVAALERLTIPGIQLHYALRKLYLEETARAALADGFRQIVIFGAGYDTLALRLHESFSETSFIELDHPATQRRKTHALAAHCDASRISNLHFLPVDLTRQQPAAALRDFHGFRADAPTLFIAEGLLMYLSPVEVANLFSTIRELGGASSRFAFTFMEPQGNDGRVNFLRRSRLVDAWLGARREVFKWGVRRDELNRYLAAHEFTLRDLATHETLRRRYLEPHALEHLPLAAGEYVCVATLDRKDN